VEEVSKQHLIQMVSLEELEEELDQEHILVLDLEEVEMQEDILYQKVQMVEQVLKL
jgi:hypothetical protein